MIDKAKLLTILRELVDQVDRYIANYGECHPVEYLIEEIERGLYDEHD